MDLSTTSPPNLHGATPDDLSGVRGMVLIYPYCGFPSQSQRASWQTILPATAVMGADGNVAPAAQCVATFDRLSADGIDIEYRVYPNTGHDFDVSGDEFLHQGDYLEAETVRAHEQALAFLKAHTNR